MRKFQKTQCLDLLGSIEEAHGKVSELIDKGLLKEAAGLLGDCQDGAIEIGNTIEGIEGEGTEAVRVLEEYCELVFQVHEDLLAERPVNRQTGKKFRKLINKAQSEIKFGIKTKYEVVFLPYKAAMWDSLESIWMAADEDPDCDAIVIPIPYFEKNRDGSLAKAHYEVDRYPSYVPVTAFSDYDLAEHHPDMIFIHNPYDEYNFVTTVMPDFYSSKLREYTECLVYVPYYATAGNLAEVQSIFFSYFTVDHIVVQSEGIVGFFDKRVPREKFLPLGSPKFDKVIRLCENPPHPPADWAEKIQGKKVFFYNTSLNGFLNDTERFMKKMAYVFDTFKGREDSCLIWRPHPLLETTMDTMRPEIRPAYEALKNYYVENDIGILDETPEIEPTIAQCDAYLGDAGTSVTSLFGVVGKPMYILNNRLHEAPGADDWQAWVCQVLRGDRNNRYCITMGNRLFEDRGGDYHYRFLCSLSDEYSGGGYYSRAMEIGEKIVVFPANAEDILVIDRDTLKKKKIKLKHETDRGEAFAGFFNFILEDPEVYWIWPNRYSSVVRFDTRTEAVSYIEDEAFSDEYSVYFDEKQRRVTAARWVFGNRRFSYLNGKAEPIDCSEEDVFIPGIKMKGRRFFCLNTEGTRLRVINMDTGEKEERPVPFNGLYTGCLRDIDNLDVMWFLPYRGTVLGKWTLSEDKWETVDVMIEGLKSISRPEGTECDLFYFSNAVFVNGKMLLAPNWGNKFVELDTNTHEAKEWIPPFEFTLEDKNDYWYNGSVGFFYQDAWTLEYFFFYCPEHKTYSLDPEAGTFREIPVSFDKEEILSMASGFHKDSQWMPYCCYEDVFNPLADIASGNIHGPAFDKKRQIEAYRMVNASPDGDCGQKVYQTLKKKYFEV